MLPLRCDAVRSILCLGAHCDDLEIGCGGTLLQLLAAAPIDVTWVVLSACGERRDEAQQSAERFLAQAAGKRIVLEEYRDSFFPQYYGQIKEFFGQLRREISPDLVFTHRREDLHQDHRLMAELTWCAFRDHTILEYEIPKYEGDLGHPNVYVPVSEDVCRNKIDTLVDAFRSQHAKPWFTPDTYWATLRLRGLECNSPTRFAEAFHGRKLVLSAGNSAIV